jgi:hypothetical protein
MASALVAVFLLPGMRGLQKSGFGGLMINIF